MKKNFDLLQIGAVVADMHSGPSKHDIDWQIEGNVRVTGWVKMEGVAVRDLMLQQVRMQTGQPMWSYTNKLMYVIQETVSGYVCAYMHDMLFGVVCTIQQPSVAHRHGGPIVMQSDTHFLRCDTVIRQEAGYPPAEQEAYSLFVKEPYGRVAVYTGTLAWAMGLANKEIAAHLETIRKEGQSVIQVS
jgi:hypothetical protein